MSQTSQTEQRISAYQALGGETAVQALTDRFYTLMDTLPEARDIRRMHPDDLTGSRTKLFEFLCGWLGGPPLYVQRYGHPFLRARHMPFAIGKSERDAWLLCMRRALEEQIADTALRQQLYAAFAGLADHMRNRPA